MTVDSATTPHHASVEGRDYHFCSTGCRAKFEARPELFLDQAPRAAAQRPEDVVYTCPMHPEIEQIGPGICPICGMALEPKGVAMIEGPSEEYVDIWRRFLVSAVLTVPLAIMVMLRHFWPPMSEIVSVRDQRGAPAPEQWRDGG